MVNSVKSIIGCGNRDKNEVDRLKAIAYMDLNSVLMLQRYICMSVQLFIN